MKKAKKISGLYAITPDLADTAELCAMASAALEGGASLIQYRNKKACPELRLEQALALRGLCREQGVPLIINDHLDLCLQMDADGLHLGGDDGNLAEARTRLGNNRILGTSCYNQLELALNAQLQGADYVAFGRCFESGTKPGALHAPLELFSRARKVLTIPVIAIGGITLENAQQVIDTGADAVAVIGALFSANDVADTARRFSNFFTHTDHHVQKPATV